MDYDGVNSFDESAEEPLIDQSHLDYLEGVARQKSLFNNFLIMTSAFAINHGCVVSCLAYSSEELGTHLGDYGNGTLCVAYSVSAFALAKPIVEMVGPKYGLVFGVLGFAIYVLGFSLAVAVPSGAWPVLLISSIIGGIAGALLWASQGKYYAANAILYADAVELPVEEINAKLAGIFAGVYLGMEMVLALLASAVYYSYPDNANAIVFSVFSVLALLSTFGMLAISDLDELGTWEFDSDEIVYNMGATARLLREDVRLLLMVPYQVAYGFVGSFVPFYIFGTVISDSNNLGDEYIGILSSVVVFAAAAVAYPTAMVAMKQGKHPVMVFGGICMAVVGAVLYFVKDKPLSRWRVIIPYLTVYGMGRGVWENTNKAVVADLYINDPDQATAGFAVISLASGFSGALGYFLFSSMMRSVSATLIFTISLLGVMCYLNVTMMEERRLSTTHETEMRSKLH